MNQPLTLKGDYEQDGKSIPLTIEITRPAVNVTLAIIVTGKYDDPRVAAENRDDATKTIFGGTAFCNPKDDFDILEGAKVACRNAMQIGGNSLWHERNPRMAAIYRGCRTLIADKRLEEYMECLVPVAGTNDLQDAFAAVLAAIAGDQRAQMEKARQQYNDFRDRG